MQRTDFLHGVYQCLQQNMTVQLKTCQKDHSTVGNLVVV